MMFVGASWGANLPVTKVMLRYFDLMPMAALRTAAATASLALLLWLIEGRRALRIDLDLGRFLLLGLMMASFFAFYALGLQFSNPITAAAVQVAGPLVASVTVRLVTGLRFDPGFGVALALTVLGGLSSSAGSLFGTGSVTFGGGEIVVLLSNVLWTLYSIKAQAWFNRASQLHRAYVASLSAMGWLTAASLGLIAARLGAIAVRRQRPLDLDAAHHGRDPGQRAWQLLLERRRQPARRRRRLAVGQSRAVFRRIVVDGLWLHPQRLPDRRRSRGLERRGLHAMAQAADDATLS